MLPINKSFPTNKANGNVARLEWVGDTYNDDANFRPMYCTSGI